MELTNLRADETPRAVIAQASAITEDNQKQLRGLINQGAIVLIIGQPGQTQTELLGHAVVPAEYAVTAAGLTDPCAFYADMPAPALLALLFKEASRGIAAVSGRDQKIIMGTPMKTSPALPADSPGDSPSQSPTAGPAEQAGSASDESAQTDEFERTRRVVLGLTRKLGRGWVCIALTATDDVDQNPGLQNLVRNTLAQAVDPRPLETREPINTPIDRPQTLRQPANQNGVQSTETSQENPGQQPESPLP